ncbi:MAG: hypothetical protein QF648_04690, partial [Candidatus Marinimicrobia bacterium]|nr:hypothetical protein [Candidatus Neomarinimicrobiota bacterium]
MKKTVLLIIPLLIILSLLFGQKKTDKPNPNKGIKTKTELKYDYEEKFGELKEILEKKIIHKYDPKGNVIEELEYDQDGSLRSKTISKYDSNGN